MTVLGANGVSVAFGVDTVLDGVTFSLNENDKLGVIGVNGCGKTTLFRVLTGELTPDAGQAFLANGKSVGLVRQDSIFDAEATGGTALDFMLGAFPELLAAEARLTDLEKKMREEPENTAHAADYAREQAAFGQNGGLTFRARAASTLLKMGLDAEQANLPLTSLSGGQRTRVALARRLCREPDILFLDEPTNHLDLDTVAYLENYLQNYRGCVLVISHDRVFLDRVTNKTLVLEYGKATLYRGGYTASAEQRRVDREIALRHYENQQREIRRQEAYIAQQKAWNRERNIIAAESRQKLLDKMVKLEKPKEAPRGTKMAFSAELASGEEVLFVRRLTMAFGAHKLFSDLTFTLRRGDRAFITGPTGCGKSTLLKLILGKLTPVSGRVEMGYHVEVGYYDQENQNLDPANTVVEELWRAYPQKTETEVRSALARFCFTGDDVFRTVSVLSGGERARLTLAKLMLSRMNLLVLDEPTNHLDIGGREALEAALADFDGTLLIVSHDRYLMERLGTRFLALSPGTGEDMLDFPVSRRGAGYTEMNEWRLSHQTGAAVASTVSANKTAYLEKKQKEAAERKQKAQTERLTKEAASLEAELTALEKELYGEAASDYQKAAELDARRAEIEARLLEIYEIIGV